MCYDISIKAKEAPMMDKLTSTARKIDIVFKIADIMLKIAFVACLVCIGIVVVGKVFDLPDEMIGNVDQLLEFIGIYGFNDKLTEMLSTMTSDILNLVWKCGIQIIIFLSALQGIPTSAKEAAAIEGATSWEFFWKITLPYVSPMILVNLVYTIIDTFTDPTNVVMEQVLTVQDDWKYGFSAAMAWSYFAIVLVAVGIIFAVMNRIVYYDD